MTQQHQEEKIPAGSFFDELKKGIIVAVPGDYKGIIVAVPGHYNEFLF